MAPTVCASPFPFASSFWVSLIQKVPLPRSSSSFDAELVLRLALPSFAPRADLVPVTAGERTRKVKESAAELAERDRRREGEDVNHKVTFAFFFRIPSGISLLVSCAYSLMTVVAFSYCWIPILASEACFVLISFHDLC